MTPVWFPGWKVVRERYSAVRSAGRGEVFYPKNDIASPLPGNGPLCVFSRYHEAETFLLAKVRSGNILPVAYILSLAKIAWAQTEESIDEEDAFPPGTVLADAVFCLE